MAQRGISSEQLVQQVELYLRQFDTGPDMRDTSCAGITQIYFILNEDDPNAGQMLNQKDQIEPVFRSEGLLD